MTRAQKLALIWRFTHRDYKGRVGGVRHILTWIEGSGTCLVRLDSLTNEQIEKKLPPHAYTKALEMEKRQ
jgi:hypothetical protein